MMTNLKAAVAALFVATSGWLSCGSSAADPAATGKTAAELSPEHFGNCGRSSNPFRAASMKYPR